MKNNEEAPRGNETGTGLREKKPYRKPSFRHERVFETRALICGKLVGSGGSCAGNHKAS
jgi:hypothetical protein